MTRYCKLSLAHDDLRVYAVTMAGSHLGGNRVICQGPQLRRLRTQQMFGRLACPRTRWHLRLKEDDSAELARSSTLQGRKTLNDLLALAIFIYVEKSAMRRSR